MQPLQHVHENNGVAATGEPPAPKPETPQANTKEHTPEKQHTPDCAISKAKVKTHKHMKAPVVESKQPAPSKPTSSQVPPIKHDLQDTSHSHGHAPKPDLQENGDSNGHIPTEERSPPPAPRPKTTPPKKSRESRPKHPARKPMSQQKPQQPAPAPVSVPKAASMPPAPAKSALKKTRADPRDARTGAMNEFVQTDLDKGVVDSRQEATVSSLAFSFFLCFVAVTEA